MASSWLSLSGQSLERWRQLCPDNSYRVVSPDDLPSIIPQRLLDNVHSCLVISSGNALGTTYIMVNLNRVDRRDRAIDQEPFGLAFFGDDPVASGCFIHHGTWPNRTTRPPVEFWDAIAASGFRVPYPLSELPSKDAGRIEDLANRSQTRAFESLVRRLQSQVDAAPTDHTSAEEATADHPMPHPEHVPAAVCASTGEAERRPRRATVSKTRVAVGSAAVLLVIYLAAAPYITVYRMKSAAEHRDGDALSEYIEFATVRQNLKDRLNAMLAQKMIEDEDLQDNPFSALGAALGGVMVDKAVDAYITPAGISQLMAGDSPAATMATGRDDANSYPTRPLRLTSMSYDSPSKFVVRIKGADGRDGTLVLRRRGLGWKMTDMNIPLE